MDKLFTYRLVPRLFLSRYGRKLARKIGIAIGLAVTCVFSLLLFDAISRSPYAWLIIFTGAWSTWTIFRLAHSKKS